MPVDDPRAGGAFIWLVASLLFVSVAVGGGCLMMYMVLPESDPSSSRLPILGVTLVCLPWLFWFLTFLYRILSRVSGFRVGIGRVAAATTGGGAVATDHHHGNTGGGDNHNVDENTSCGDDDDHQQHPLGSTADVNPMDQVQFAAAAAMMMNERGHDDDDDDHHGKINGGKYSSRSSSNSSNVSHESEMPLALSMAS